MAFGIKKNQADTQTKRVLTKIQDSLLNSGPITSVATEAYGVNYEQLSSSQQAALASSEDSLSNALESIVHTMISDKMLPASGITEAQRKAAIGAGMFAASPMKALRSSMSLTPAMENNTNTSSLMPSSVPDAQFNRSWGLEAYDESENKNAALFSITYNMQASRQDEFGESLFPTITINPDEVGASISIDLMTVMDSVTRDISGSFTDFERVNVIRSLADNTVLQKEQTRAYPIHRADTAANFVDPAVIAPRNILIDRTPAVTSALAFGKRFDIIGISQTQELLAKGAMDQTDSLSPAVNLTNVYASFANGADTDTIAFKTKGVPTSAFAANPQDNYRTVILSFVSDAIQIRPTTTQVDGSAMVALAGLTTGNQTARLRLSVNGRINIETGETELTAGGISLHTLTDVNGDQVDTTAGAGAATKTLLEAGTLIGYDLEAWRNNLNRRQQGQLINTTKFTQIYNVALLSPITALHPINIDDSVQSSDIQTLVTTTRFRIANDGVSALLNASSTLAEFADVRDAAGRSPDVLGIGSKLVRPSYKATTIDMAATIDSLSSKDRPEDIRAVLVNEIRDAVFNLYRDSEYKAAADALNGGEAPTPTVVIATDQVLGKYLTVMGDLRTLSNDFEVKVVTSLDKRMYGKIFVTFGVFDSNRNTAINPLNFGNMVWAPELVLNANIARGGQISAETVVQPRYLFIVNLPILAEITVTNVNSVLNRIGVYQNNL